jgi:hypothetical protein
MPNAIIDAIQRARAGSSGTITDTGWRERLAERFGSPWRIPKLRARKGGTLAVDPVQEGAEAKKIKKKITRIRTGSGGGAGGRGGALNTGSAKGTIEAAQTLVAGGLPTFRAVRANEIGEGMLAAWSPNDPLDKAGVVLINIDHPVLAAEIERWQSQFADHLAEEIGKDVVQVYGEMAVAKVAHSEHLKGIIPAEAVDKDLRSDAALTMSLLGLIGEEAILAPRLGGKYRKRRDAA